MSDDRLNFSSRRARRSFVTVAVRLVVWRGGRRHGRRAGRSIAAAVVALGAMTSLLPGCSTSSSSSSSDSASLTGSGNSATAMRMTRAPGRVVPPTSDDARVRQATAEELGPDAAASMPQVRASTQASGGDSAEARQPAQPIDEGAAALVQSIAVALAHRPVNAQGMTVISLDELRNYSRAGHGEFNHMLRRMAWLLTQAGRERRLEFVADDGAAAGSADQRPHYRMQGAAYLITAAGFDQWELFLSMTPMDRDMTVWDARSATRVLRTEREGVTQMTYPVDRGGGAP